MARVVIWLFQLCPLVVPFSLSFKYRPHPLPRCHETAKPRTLRQVEKRSEA